jgi:opacity protein-like surface antigen
LGGGGDWYDSLGMGNSSEAYTTKAGGGFVFFDATYAELSVGFSSGQIKYKYHSEMTMPISTTHIENKGTYTALDFSLLGKIPFNFGRFTLFPLAGVTYQRFLSVWGLDTPFHHVDNDASKLNAWWFKAGAGMDFNLNDSFYLRGEFLYGVRTRQQWEKDMQIHLGHGPTVKLGVGYRFN